MARHGFKMHLPRANNTSCVCRIKLCIRIMYYSPSGGAFSSCFGHFPIFPWPWCLWPWYVFALSSNFPATRIVTKWVSSFWGPVLRPVRGRFTFYKHPGPERIMNAFRITTPGLVTASLVPGRISCGTCRRRSLRTALAARNE